MDNIFNKIKDIKPNVVVNDHSLYLFIAFVLFCIVLLILVSFILYKKFKKPKYNFDLSNPKKTAYKLITLIRDKDGSNEYIEKLHTWTYKKEVPPFDEKLFVEIKNKFLN